MGDVIAVFAQHRITLTKRRLTDWIQKGLLPPLLEQRNSRGQIARYVWTQPCLVEQVATVIELRTIGIRTQQSLGILWLLGYDIALEKAQGALCQPLASTWGLWGRGVSTLDEVEDNISRYAVRVSRRRRARPEQFPLYAEASAAMETILNLVINPRYEITQTALELALSFRPEPSSGQPSRDEVLRMLNQSSRFRQVFLIPRLYEAIISASPTEYNQALADFANFRQALKYLWEMFPPTEWSTRRDLFWTRRSLLYSALATFGPWLIAADIALHRAGYGHTLETYLRFIRRQMRRFSSDSNLRDQLAQAQAKRQPQRSSHPNRS